MTSIRAQADFATKLSERTLSSSVASVRRMALSVLTIAALGLSGGVLMSDNAAAACGNGSNSGPGAHWSNCGFSGGGGGGGGRGGGGNNVAAGLGAAAAGLGVLGQMLEEADRAEQAARANQAAQESAREAAQRAYCNANYRQAAADINTGNDLINHWRAGDAIPYYRSAIAYLSRCGDVHNIEIAKRNLREAQKQYAAVAPDNRVDDAMRRYGDQNPYNKLDNPFPGRGAAADAAPKGTVAPNDVLNTARQRCAQFGQDATHFNQCMRVQEARAIMEGDPEIQATCGLESSATARNTCAINEYMAKLKAQQAANPVDGSCYFRKNGTPCLPGSGSADAQNRKPGAIGDRLRKALSAADAPDAPQPDTAKSDASTAGAAKSSDAAGAQPPANAGDNKVADQNPGYDPDDPLRNYLQSQNTNSGGLNNGNLVPPGTRPMLGLTPPRPGERF